MFETIIKLKRFLIPFIILVLVLSVFQSANPLAVIQFYVITIFNLFLKIMFQIPTWLVNMVLWNTPIVLTPDNFFFYFSWFFLLSLSVYSIIWYFIYQLLSYKWEYGTSIWRTFLDFLKWYVSFQDVWKKIMNFFWKNPFFSIVSAWVIILFIVFSWMNLNNTYVITSNSNIETIKITNESVEKYIQEKQKWNTNVNLIASVSYKDWNNITETITSNNSNISLRNDISIKTLWDLWNLSTSKFPISNEIITNTKNSAKTNISNDKIVPYNDTNINNVANAIFNKSLNPNDNLFEKNIDTYTNSDFINDYYKLELINNLPTASLKGMYLTNFFITSSHFFVYKTDYELFLKTSEDKYNNNLNWAINDYFSDFRNWSFVNNFNILFLLILLNVFWIINWLVLFYYYIRKVVFNEYIDEKEIKLNSWEKIKINDYDSKSQIDKETSKENYKLNELKIEDNNKTFSENLKNDVFTKEVYDIWEKREIEKAKIKEELNNFIDEQAELWISEKLEDKEVEIYKEYELELKDKVSNVYSDWYIDVLETGIEIKETDDEEVIIKKTFVNDNIETLKDLKNEKLALELKDKNYEILLNKIDSDIWNKEKSVELKNELDKIDNELNVKKMLLDEETIPEKRVIIKEQIKKLEETRKNVYQNLFEQSGSNEKVEKLEQEYSYLSGLSKNYKDYTDTIEENNNIDKEIKELLSQISETGDTKEDKEIIEKVNFLELKKENNEKEIKNRLKDMISWIKDEAVLKKTKNITWYLQKKEELEELELKHNWLQDYLVETSIYEKRDKEIKLALETETDKSRIEELEKELKLNKLQKNKIRWTFIKNWILKKDDFNKPLDVLYEDRSNIEKEIKWIKEKLDKVPDDLKILDIDTLSNMKNSLLQEHIEKAWTDIERIDNLKSKIEDIKNFTNVDFNKDLYDKISEKETYSKEKDELINLMKQNNDNYSVLKYEMLWNIYASDENEERKNLIKSKIDSVQKEEFNKYDSMKKEKIEEFRKQIIENNKLQIETDFNKVQDLNLMNFEIQQIREKIEIEKAKNNEIWASILEEDLRWKILKRDNEYDVLDLWLKTETWTKLQNLKRKLESTQKESVNYKVIQSEISGIKKELVKEIKENEKKILDFKERKEELDIDIQRLTQLWNDYELVKAKEKLEALTWSYIKEWNETKVSMLKKLYKEMF